MRLCCHSTSGGPPPGLQWPRDIAAISPLVGASTSEKMIKRAREEAVGYPDMLQRGRRNWRGCASAGNGRASHQASRWCKLYMSNFGVEPNAGAPTLSA
jgi:hypothetical protein